MTITPLNLALRSAQTTPLSWVQEDGNFSAIQTAVNALVSGNSGQMTLEGPFIAGVGFTPGTTSTLTLSQTYVSPQNISVHFDGVYQGPDTYTLSGSTVIFNSVIPVGTSEVYIVGGSTLPINTPAPNSVGLSALQTAVLNYFTQSSVLSGSLGAFIVGSGFPVLSTIAALRAINSVQPATRVFVTGYYAEGDGGGGPYRLNTSDTTSADNGGTILVDALGRRWYMVVTNNTTTIEQWGAKGDGVTVDSTAYANAIAWTAANHKTLLLSEKTYVLNVQLVIGNGSNSAPSTLNNFSVLGTPSNAEANEVSPLISGTQFLWTGGSTSNPVVLINGPCVGINFSGVVINCNNTAQQGISFSHPIRGQYQDITVINNVTGYAISHTAYSNPTNCVIGSSNNNFVRLNNNTPGTAGNGIVIGGNTYTGSAYLDVARNVYSNCSWAWDNTYAAGSVGLALQFCDNNTFIECQSQGVGAGTYGYSQYINPPTGTGGTAFPEENTFINCPFIGPKLSTGTWAPTNGNGYFPYPTSDGETLPSSPVNFNSNFGVTTKSEWFGGLSFGVGNPAIKQHLSVTQALTFGTAIPAQGATSQSVTVTGAAAGDTVVVTNASGAIPAGGILQAIVNSANTVTVIWTNASSASITPGTATYRIDVWKH